MWATWWIAAQPAQPKLDPKTVRDHSSYGFGFRSGRQFASQISRFGLNIEDIDQEPDYASAMRALGLSVDPRHLED